MTHATATARKKKPRRGHGKGQDGIEKPSVTDPNTGATNASPPDPLFVPTHGHGPKKPSKH